MSMTQSQLPPNEAELIESVRAGEREAFYELVRPYERMVYATAISVVKNTADAEEVAQEAVLKAFSGLSRFRGEAKFSTDRKSTRLNSSHGYISYAVFCLKKKNRSIVF